MKNEIKRRLILLASLSGKQLPDSAIEIYLNALLSELSEENVVRAIDRWVKNATSNQMPMPGQLVSLIKPKETEKDQAILLAKEIEKIIPRKQNWTEGYMVNGEIVYEGSLMSFHKNWIDAAKEVLGDIGAKVVERLGWSRLVNNYFEMDPGQFHAQLRDSINATTNSIKAGNLTYLDSAEKNEMSSLIGDLANMKMLK